MISGHQAVLYNTELCHIFGNGMGEGLTFQHYSCLISIGLQAVLVTGHCLDQDQGSGYG